MAEATAHLTAIGRAPLSHVERRGRQKAMRKYRLSTPCRPTTTMAACCCRPMWQTSSPVVLFVRPLCSDEVSKVSHHVDVASVEDLKTFPRLTSMLKPTATNANSSAADDRYHFDCRRVVGESACEL